MPARCAVCGSIAVVAAPPTWITPASGARAPVISLINVDLPAPFSPTSACTSPGCRSKEIPFSARTAAYDLVSPSRRSNPAGLFCMSINALHDAKRLAIIRRMPTPVEPGRTRDPYLVKSVVHAAQLLSAFRSAGEALPLREISARSGLPKSMTFRLLYTLERCGMIEKAGENLYRSHLRPFKQRPFRLGYAAQGTDYQFSKEVSTGLQRAAAAQGLELICVDNRYNAKTAQRNADVLVREKVDLVIEFQTDEHVAPIVASKYREAGIPMIALEIPHPGATYFGANNYEAGLIGGRHLGRIAKHQRYVEADEIIL